MAGRVLVEMTITGKSVLLPPQSRTNPPKKVRFVRVLMAFENVQGRRWAALERGLPTSCGEIPCKLDSVPREERRNLRAR